MRLIILLISLVSIGLALVVAAAGPGTRLGYWDYGFGLGLIRQLAIPVMIAAAASLAGFIGSLIFARGLALLALVALLMSGAASIVPIKMKQLVDANPFIHDITTDFDNPPMIIAAADLERSNPPDYVGDETAPGANITIAEAQREAFPDIEPKMVDASLDETVEIVSAVVGAMGMEILDDGPTEIGWRIEAASTSMWFGFVDDFIVRLTPEGASTRVDVRSKSRVGVSDLGANAARIRTFFEKLEGQS